MSENHSSVVSYKSLDFLADEGYRVGSDGSLWSRLIKKGWGKPRSGFYVVLGKEWKRLNPSILKRKWSEGYLITRLRTNGKMKSYYVHRLILEAFVGPRPEGMQCRHLDGNPQNNRLDNLCWGTHTENMEDQKRHGRTKKGITNNSAKLTENDVREIRRRYKEERKPTQIGREFGVTRAIIWMIGKGKLWSHVV